MSSGRRRGNKLNYIELLNCKTPGEVYTTVRNYISGLTEQEHLVRSTILDIHADLERAMKQAFYQVMLDSVFHGDDDDEYKQSCVALEEMVDGLSFGAVYNVLKPLFAAFPADDLASIKPIQDVRNSVAHRTDMSKIDYRGRNPFTDPDCLAQLYLDGWAVREEIAHFLGTMVLDRRGLFEHYAKFYQENYRSVADKRSPAEQEQPK
jgi:hypothetical protein